MIRTLCLCCFFGRRMMSNGNDTMLDRSVTGRREIQLSLLLEDFAPEFETLTPACWSLARIMALLTLLGSGEKSRSVSGSSRGRPLRPPRPRAPPRGAEMGALIGIRVIGGSGPPSRVMTSLGPGLGPGTLGELEPGPWGPGPGLGPRKLKDKRRSVETRLRQNYWANVYPNLYIPGYCWFIIALAFAISYREEKHSQSMRIVKIQLSPLTAW